ncbi:MAG TPA: glutamate ABC transporter substrate-binding protein [Natronosporangium sp.]
MRSARANRLVAVVGVLVVGLAGCGGGGGRVAPQVEPTNYAPWPAGVEDPANVAPADPAGSESCDPRASYRPDGLDIPPGSTMDQIRDRGRLVVGVAQNTYLFGYRDPTDGQLKGFDIDIAQEIARALFGDPDRIQFRAVVSGDREAVLQQDLVDIVVSTMTMNCERWQNVAFSTEYYSAGQRVLVTAGSAAEGIDDLGGQRVCAASGSTSIENVAAAESGPIPVAVPDWTDCLVMLQQGQVDAISTDDSILAGLAAQDPTTKVVGEPFSEEPYGIAVRSSERDLVRYVNAVLEQLRSDGTWTDIYNRWLADHLGRGAEPPPARYRD